MKGKDRGFYEGGETDEDRFPTPTQPFFQASEKRPLTSIAITVPDSQNINLEDANNDVRVNIQDLDALKVWRDVQNPDRFFELLYRYYHGKGLSVMYINSISNLVTMSFVAFMTLFLRYCVDWSFLWKPATEADHPKLSDIVHLLHIFKMSFFMYACTVLIIIFLSWQAWTLVQEWPKWKRIKVFFNHVLLVEDDELPTFEFNHVINKLIYLERRYPLLNGKIDACQIANRIMRRENYLIALFNKDIIDLSLPIPFVKTPILTKTLEWNLSFAIISYIFDENLAVKKSFLKDSNKHHMVEGLKKRFQLLALVNMALAPILFIFLCLHFLFKYGEELYKNPKVLGERQYTPYARWKFREFNELPHFFDKRLSLSHRKANRYMEQFHNEKLIAIGKLLGYVSGSLCFILIAMTAINEDLLMNFEITKGKSILWYLAFFGGLLALSRAVLPDRSKARDPAELMEEIQEYTHYMPKHWKISMYSEKVKEEFGELYNYQFLIFAHELASVILTPYVLWFDLPRKATQIVEFFREFTIHVDNLGYVCSFALFDFNRHGNPKYGSYIGQGTKATKFLRSKQGKMEKSFISFASNYPDWTPNQQGSVYLSKLKDFDMNQSTIAGRRSKFLRPPKESIHATIEEDEDSIEDNPGIMALLNEYYEYRKQHTAT